MDKGTKRKASFTLLPEGGYKSAQRTPQPFLNCCSKHTALTCEANSTQLFSEKGARPREKCYNLWKDCGQSSWPLRGAWIRGEINRG